MPRTEKRVTTKPLIFGLIFFAACTADRGGSIPAADLAGEYAGSSASARKKYDGKTIVVRGRLEKTPEMPATAEAEGLAMIEAGERLVVCRFTHASRPAFSRLAAGRTITVEGVFNGERGTELTFCKLVSAM